MVSKKLRLNIGDDGQLSVTSSSRRENGEKNEEEVKRKICLGGKVVSGAEKKLRFIVENRFEESDVFFGHFLEEITDMRLTGTKTNKILELSNKLIETHTKIILKLLENENQAKREIVETIKETSEHMTKELNKISTASKRLVKFRNNSLYVEPTEVSLDLKWRSKSRADNDLPSHSLIPSTCQYVPTSKTLKAIFSQPDFRSVYLNYNLNGTHNCQDGIYVNFLLRQHL